MIDRDELARDALARRDWALDKLDALEDMPLAESAPLWAEHVGHINTDGNQSPDCIFCTIRIDLDFRLFNGLE